MKILTVLGARPQFIKAAPVSTALKQARMTEVMVHTGQHYDKNMSDVFFEELSLDKPAYALDIGSGSRSYQVAEGIKRLEPIIASEKPDMILVYGDTNATFSGAFAAVAHNTPLAHVEAGLRSYNRIMPEETNRVLTDHLSQWCFAPTQAAMDNLAKEGIATGTLVGDVMLDALLHFQGIQTTTERQQPSFLEQHDLQPGQYYLLTMHRAETTSQPERVKDILSVLEAQDMPVVFPVHPRIRPLVEAMGPFKQIRCIDPIGYLDMLTLESNANRIVTDSGGVQKEAAMLGIPCITLRTETEWVETLSMGCNVLVGLSTEKLSLQLNAPALPIQTETVRAFYGDGHASLKIAQLLTQSAALPV